MHILCHYKRLSLIMDAKDMFVLKALFILIIKKSLYVAENESFIKCRH